MTDTLTPIDDIMRPGELCDMATIAVDERAHVPPRLTMSLLETLRAARDAGANPETVVILGVPVRVVNVVHLLAALDVVDALTAERDDLRATLANERGEGEPPSKGCVHGRHLSAAKAAWPERAAERAATIRAMRSPHGDGRAMPPTSEDAMTDITPAILTALSDGMAPNALRELVERAIWTHAGLLPLAERIAPGAAWVCDPGGLGYPTIHGEEFFVGVCDDGTWPKLTISVGASPDPDAAGWRHRSFDLRDEDDARLLAKSWLRGMVPQAVSLEPRTRNRALSAAGCLRALGWS